MAKDKFFKLFTTALLRKELILKFYSNRQKQLFSCKVPSYSNKAQSTMVEKVETIKTLKF
ncbi:unnamed protein product [Paramecium sonneborni]|uniref:Uncharacterized protein n=1 Tax=Paramecium sonneborni TaxID=65129 RepID=A0A8S1MKN7_9CILI|nr:unnamed protein product [Paramecium sonneborni]